MGNLQGKVAVVTGAGKGIGAATAVKLADDGAKVAVIDLKEEFGRHTVDTIQSKGGEAIAVGCDVSSREEVDAAADHIHSRFGRVDILVNNAGVTRDNLLFKMSEDEWDIVLDTHLKGSFLVTKAFQQYMVEQKYGKIVTTSSLGALGKRGQANYSAAKAGLQGLTRTFALELGKFNINANCVAPGFIETDMTRATAERQGMDFDEVKKGASKSIPIGRVGQPEDIANVVSFLVSDEASYVTGEVLYVGGGAR
ncbi:3-oxoacyl-[acyl-carrier protein] reductase [Alteribacillus persepolensis]|uniref:3-oxoacyl-[acyl-carrier protein] reductase n=1 Tax=Alteribacillus persepolensis TaxID=568899 RepID=A0A1G8AVJ7_9BACI|nr:beta-ketoacyl-ACP reductase [Alteribacillus persepolensis]SDH24833.1 3-oxoacyl-[acyl-carrier protein] reductase [Alteribacillus persepolensis]